ncbi:zonular occludens toxin domain-containing protein [Alkanindiges sp. WGS2144]|uniref:zonular occludens toxin domain-containing protein n=1 Tax=Alkanindiges sp. WGS2144 TaxID=3366808 RepID=UPI0037515244
MIILITGTPGSGKTLFAVSKIIQWAKENKREIYSDIDGLNIQGIEKSPEDWRETPDGSIVVYDEAQQHQRFAATRGQRSQDEIVQAMEVHRHTGHDIIFITQSPKFLHNHILDLVGEHYHLHRPYGASLATVYYWRRAVRNPASQTQRALVENEFLFKYPKDLFKVYKSSNEHNVKFKLPKKLWLIIGAIVALSIFVWKITFSDNTQNFINGKSPVTNAQGKTVSNPLDPKAKPDAQAAGEAKPSESEQVPQAPGQDMNRNVRTIVYDPNKPFETDYSNYQYQAMDAPRFAGCMATPKGGCNCYDQQGATLKVSATDCKAALKALPFNPQKQPEPAIIARDPLKQLEVIEKINQAQTPDQVYKVVRGIPGNVLPPA